MASETPLRRPLVYPQQRSPVPYYVGGAVVLIGIGLLLYLQLAPKSAPAEPKLTPEAQAYATTHLALSDVGMQAKLNYFSQKVLEIDGKITNTGDRNVQQVEINCVFTDVYGQAVLRQRVSIVSEKMGGLKPGETKPFRLPFDELPDNWNQKMPALVIASVTF